VHSYRLLGQSASFNAASLSDMAHNSASLYLVPRHDMMPGLETQFEETFGGTAGFALAAHARRTPSRRGR